MDAQALSEAAFARVHAAIEAASDMDDFSLAVAAQAREIDAHAAHPEVQASLLFSLSSCAADCSTPTRAIADRYAPHLTLDALRDIADVALRALRANATASAIVAAAAFSALYEPACALPAHESAGAVIRLAVEALRGSGDFAAHAASEEVACAACVALSNAMVDDKQKMRLAADAGALGALVAAMRRFPRCRALQICACSALYDLFAAFPAELQADADARHAAGAATATLSAFPDDARLAKEAAFALGAFVNRNTALHTRELLTSFIRAVTSALRRHVADERVAEACCSALGCLDFSSPVMPPSAVEAVVDDVMAALRTHSAHAVVQESGLFALWSAFRCPHAVAHAVAAGAVAAAVRAMRGHRAAPCVQAAGCCVLKSLLDNDVATRARAGALGAVAAVVDVLRAGRGSSADALELERSDAKCRRKYGQSPQEWAVTALRSLLRSNLTDNCLRAVHAGALSVLQTPRVQAAASSKLDELAVVITTLKTTAEEHLRSRPACAACTALRACGAMCGFAGCAACARPEDGGRLLVCARCRRAAYCCKAHQQAAWRASHKAQCVLFQSDAAAGSTEQQQ
jgi:hypothetical protein